MPILTLITYLSDNAKGTCTLPISKMQELFKRSRQCIVDNILALEEDGIIGVARIDGMPNRYWPRIPAGAGTDEPEPGLVRGGVDDQVQAAHLRKRRRGDCCGD